MWPFNRKSETMQGGDPAAVPVRDPAGTYINNGENFQLANITIGQLVDAFSGTGADGLSTIYKPRFYNRNSAICFVTLQRAVQLISGTAAFLLGNGYFRVCDRFGNEIKSAKADAVYEMFTHSMDGRLPSSYSIGDGFSDYLLDGNILYGCTFGAMGEVTMMQRLVPWSAQIIERNDMEDVYRAEYANFRGQEYKVWRGFEVVHGRLPLTRRIYGTGGFRNGFATPPVSLMRPILEAGLELDEWVRTWSRRAPIQNLNISFSEQMAKVLTPDQRQEIWEHVKEEQNSPTGVSVIQDGSVSDITPKFDKERQSLREYSVKEVARFYGIPKPLIGEDISTWGSGVAELGRMFRNYCLTPLIQGYVDAVAFRCLEPGAHIEVDYTRLLQSDPAGMKSMIEAGMGDAQRPGVISVKEARKWLGLPAEVDGEIANPMQAQADAAASAAPMEAEPDADGTDDDVRALVSRMTEQERLAVLEDWLNETPETPAA